VTVVVEGLAELTAAYTKMGRAIAADWRASERTIAEPVRSDAQHLASSRIRNIGKDWPVMRTGTTRSVVYVAPAEHGTRGRGNRTAAQRAAGTKFAGMLMDRAMEPALKRNEARVTREIERLVDRAIDRFNAGGF